MKLRSGTTYDPSLEVRRKDFMRFDNLLFTAIWDDCREHYMDYIEEDYFNKQKIKKACKVFAEMLLKEVDKVIGTED